MLGLNIFTPVTRGFLLFVFLNQDSFTKVAYYTIVTKQLYF